MRTASSTNRKVQAAFACAVAALLIAGTASYRGMVIASRSQKWVEHTHEVLDNLQDVLLAVESIQSSFRGYVLTGEQSRVKTYLAGRSDAQQHLARLHDLTKDNPVQIRQLPPLDTIARREFEFADEVIALRQRGSTDQAVQLLRSDQGIRILNDLQSDALAVHKEELRLLAVRSAETEHRLLQTKIILALGTLLAIAIATLATLTVRRETIRRAVAEQAYRQSEEQFRGLLEAAPDALIVVTDRGEIILSNKQAARQFGYASGESPSPLIGSLVEAIIPGGLYRQPTATLIELSGRRSDHSHFPIEIMLSPLVNADRVLIIASIRDITERRQAEERLRKTARELTRSNLELEQFAYIASHDLQEPLRTVASYTELLGRRYQGRLDPDADDFIAFAVDGCLHMKTLIQDLLAYSRVGLEHTSLHSLSGQQAILDALGNLRIMIQESGAILIHDPIPESVAFDSQLTQIFQNLVSNAIKFRRDEAPQIHISAVHENSEWTFSVKDNGLGIEPQYFEKIFVLFQRLHSRQQFSGTGIGLAICKKILDNLGGRIWVESTLHQGSTFCFTLPAVPVTQSLAQPSIHQTDQMARQCLADQRPC